MTPEDKAYLDAKFANIWAGDLTSESGLSTSKVSASRWLTTAGDHAFVANQTLSKLDPAAIRQAVVDACTEALADATVTVDVEAIATAVLSKISLVQRADS